MKKMVFICAVCGVGKTTVCNYIKDNKLLDNYYIVDIDDLENIHEYADNYNLFYENAIKNAVEKSDNRNIIIGSCINPTDIKKINIPKEIGLIDMIAITCSEEELIKRLKKRPAERNCGSEEFIKGQIEYQKWILNNIDLYDFNIDNSNIYVPDTALRIINYINKI